jgi:hypothetical protein
MNSVLAGLFFKRLAIGVLHLDRMQRVETRSDQVQGRAQRAVNGCLAPQIAPTIAQVRRRMEGAVRCDHQPLSQFSVCVQNAMEHSPQQGSVAFPSDRRQSRLSRASNDAVWECVHGVGNIISGWAGIDADA